MLHGGKLIYLFVATIATQIQRGVRAVEGARLESVYTPKGYRGFESLPLCIPIPNDVF